MRSLIYLDISSSGHDSHSQDGIEEGQLPNWTITRTSSIQATEKLLENNTISICVVCINQNLIVKNRAQFEAVVNGFPSVEWLAISPSSLLKLSSVCQFIKNNFYDYHVFPLDYKRLNTSLGHAFGMANLIVSTVSEIKEQVTPPTMIGQSVQLKRVTALIAKIAPVDASVLITGESGTGKELVARAIHSYSGRADKPFVAINCGAIPENLIQSELFGHEKGAFTGANQKRIGRLEAANGGTLFLDEIGDLPFKLQVNLLRCLQEGIIERVGGGQKINLDLRVIAATNVDLEQAITEGLFREDLYYRINVFNIAMPPLRERGADAKLLAHHYLTKWSSNGANKPITFSKKSEQIITSYGWPGNIRELTNRVKRAVLLCDSSQITPEDLGFSEELDSSQQVMTLADAREEADKSVIAQSLACTDHNITAASKLLDISRLSLYRLMSKYALDSKQPNTH